MFGSENVHSVTLNIESDPGGNDVYQLMKAPRAGSVKAAYYVGENTQAAGTGFTMRLLNYGTAGTAVETGGTITNALGTGISADIPTEFTLVPTAVNFDEGDWLVWTLTEVGGGWQSGDRVQLQVNYVLGQ